MNTVELAKEYFRFCSYIEVDESGRINTGGSVSLRKEVNKLPVSFGNVSGDFVCSYNRLATLEGAPAFVGGNYECQQNALRSLEGCPRQVVGTFNCSHNNILDFHSCPESVGRDFCCYGNGFDSFIGLTTEVGGRLSFDCNYGKLITLEGIADGSAGLPSGSPSNRSTNARLDQSVLGLWLVKCKSVTVSDPILDQIIQTVMKDASIRSRILGLLRHVSDPKYDNIKKHALLAK